MTVGKGNTNIILIVLVIMDEVQYCSGEILCLASSLFSCSHSLTFILLWNGTLLYELAPF